MLTRITERTRVRCNGSLIVAIQIGTKVRYNINSLGMTRLIENIIGSLSSYRCYDSQKDIHQIQ
jgi:hypothetical protein